MCFLSTPEPPTTSLEVPKPVSGASKSRQNRFSCENSTALSFLNGCHKSPPLNSNRVRFLMCQHKFGCSMCFRVATVSVELQCDAGGDCASGSFFHPSRSDDIRERNVRSTPWMGQGAFHGNWLNNKAKQEADVLSNCWGKMHSQDVCFMGAEHDWAEWIKLHELIRAVNDPWQIMLVPAAPPLPVRCVGEKRAFYSSTLRDEGESLR